MGEQQQQEAENFADLIATVAQVFVLNWLTYLIQAEMYTAI